MDIIDIREYEEEIVLHFGGELKKINAYTLASSLVSIADALKEANSIINPGYEIEVLVEAFGEGSFRAKIKTACNGLNNIFTPARLEQVAVGIFTAFIFQHTLAPDCEHKVNVDDTQVIIEQGDKKIIIPKSVYDAQKEVEKSERFRKSVSQTFEAVEKDSNITEFGLTKHIEDKTPDIIIPRERFYLLSQPIEIDEPQREIQEVADLQIKRAILERSKRKWEFIWRGIKISAPVLDDHFYTDFFAHKVTIAPGDSFEVVLKIYQSRYEVTKVNRHIPRYTQADLDV